ncbi:MAG: methyltransferase domain-containing protein [archaeon]
MDKPKTRTNHPHESTWDHHGSYQWTYFSDEVKQRINFFLSRRLHGKNIDVGGGWYLSYPNSTVVDLSSVCLAHNPAKEKLQFDLDELGGGKHLPYGDKTFDSATLISVWQYLKHPIVMKEELERILKPGAEIYLINGQGGALQECAVSSGRSQEVQRFFQEQGYNSLVENIPSFGGDVNEFQSVCVAMPDRDLFGVAPSRVRNKEKRAKENGEVCQDPSIFQNAFADWELRKRVDLLSAISTFPITKYSQEYLERIERFSQEYHNQTGGVPLIFDEHTIEPELLMLTPDYKFLFATMFLMGEEKAVDRWKGPADDLLKKHRLGFSRHCNYFDFETKQGLLEHCEKFEPRKDDYWGRSSGNETELRKYANFISAIGMNSFTRELQTQIHQRLEPRVKDLDERVERQRAFGYHMATFEGKQQRKIDRLVDVKRAIEGNGTEVAGEGKLDYHPYVSKMREFILR